MCWKFDHVRLILVGFLHLKKELVILHCKMFVLEMWSCSLKEGGGLRSYVSPDLNWRSVQVIINHYVKYISSGNENWKRL